MRSFKCQTKMTWFFSYDKIIDLQSIKNNSQIMNSKPLNGMLTPTKNLNYNTRNTDKIALFYTKHNFFQKKEKFSSTVIEWKKVDPNLWSAASLNVFENNFL